MKQIKILSIRIKSKFYCRVRSNSKITMILETSSKSFSEVTLKIKISNQTNQTNFRALKQQAINTMKKKNIIKI